MGKAVAKAEEKYTPGGTSVQLTPQVQGRTKAAEAYGKTGEALGKGASGEFQAAHEGRTATQADKTAAVNAGDITPQLSRPFVAAQTALEGLDRLEGAIKKGMANRVGQKLERLGADTDIAAEADHTSQSVGFGEANGNVPNDKRVESLKHNFESMNPEQALAHIHALRETFLEKQRSIVNTSKRTARVGHTAPVESSE